MAEFRVTHTFALEARSLFVLAGAVVSGEVRSGMFVRIRFNSSVAMTAPIEAIEFARQPCGAEEVCLCIRYADTHELSVWRGLNIGDETFEVVADSLARARAPKHAGPKRPWFHYLLLWPFVLDADRDKRNGRFLTAREWAGWALVGVIIVLAVAFM